MNTYKILGAKDCRFEIKYCQIEIEADKEETAIKLYLNQTNYQYDIIRVDQIHSVQQERKNNGLK